MIDYHNLPLSELLPHKPPMILIDRVVDFKDDFIHASLTICKNALFFENDSVPAYVSIEYMAQTVGIWSGLNLLKINKPPRLGFLMGTRRLRLEMTRFEEGSVLDVFGKCIYYSDTIGSFECRVEIMETLAASATLNVFQPDN